jgi:hypothetical protein
VELAMLLPIAAFIALAAGLAVVLRGTGRIVARTRELEQFKTRVRDLAARVDESLDAAASQIDAVRRRQIDPQAISETLAAASDALERYTDEAKALPGPKLAQGVKAGLVEELGRAARAVDMVRHGASTLTTARGPMEMEAQTSIKRGYLNLLHAREAIARHALEAAQLKADDHTM